MLKEFLKNMIDRNKRSEGKHVQNSLGNAYYSLAEIRDKEFNNKKAINAFQESLTIRTFETRPEEYATTMNSLGNAYSILSEVRDKEPNIRKTINAYQEALKIFTVERYAYIMLADVRDKDSNLKKAVDAFNATLKIFEEEKYLIKYQIVKSNLEKAQSQLSI